MRVVDLADRFHLTTSEALDLCEAAGVPAVSSDTELSAADADRWLALAEEQQAWRRAAADDAARAHVATADATAAPVTAGGMPEGNDFGPIPPAPWETPAGSPGAAPVHDAPLALGQPGDLEAGWGLASGPGPAPKVSIWAALALALGILSFVVPFVPALAAFWLAWLAKLRIRAHPERLTGEKLALAGQVAAAVGMVLWLGLLAAALYSDSQTDPNKVKVADLQVDTSVRQWNELNPGTCVRVPKADLSVAEWQAVRCDAPHEGEVIATRNVARAAGDPYPGRASFIPLATDECKAAFATYVGVPYEASGLKLGVVFPTASNWNAVTDRTIACIVYQDHYDYINGSLEGAKR